MAFLQGLRPSRRVGALLAALAAVAALAGPAAGAKQDNVTITVDTLPIANALPMDLGVKKGFFDAQGITIKKQILQSGNDIVLALANHNGDVGYLGYVPMMIARTQGIPLTVVAASEVEGTSETDNWQNILVKGSSSIKAPADLSGKTVALNALKGVGEVVVKAALQKVGVNPDSVKFVALPFPSMRTALNNGQVDAIWTPEPFLSQALNLDGDRIVMAPGPALGKYFPNGGYGALQDWVTKNPELATKFRSAMNQSLTYAQSHPDEIRAMLPAGSQNSRLAVWSPLIDRVQLVQLAKYAKQYGIISTLPNMTQLVPSSVLSGKLLQATVGGNFVTVRLDGKVVTSVPAGKYTVVVNNLAGKVFKLTGPGVSKKATKKGTVSWNVTLSGTYRYAAGKVTRSFRAK
ncbi:MAG TPA: ABC transporter substrate-binding protein [Gaiellaceae bacterium]|nr:ABC transporter substrate-binding protein [Gaiellaceae bacterium]